MTDNEFLAWVAGFFDGEGCVTVTRHKTVGGYNHRLFVSITQQDNRALIKVKERFGGGLVLDKNRGNIPVEKRHVVWRWRATSHVAYEFLHVIAPYCMVKDKQVAIALDWPLNLYKGRAVPRHIWKKRDDIMNALRDERNSVKELSDA